MEPRAGAPQAADLLSSKSQSRVRLLAACLLLVGVALVQDPGFLVADTKFDLVEAPTDFLARALHLWDEQGAFGQLQNQAYGYLWPIGSFFAAGVLAGIPGWLVQRLWLGLVMAVALAGTVKVSKALGVRSDLACLTAGFAFALSPRMLTVLGPISIEAWPSAVAPWVLLALIHGSRTGSPRRWAALAGLAVAMVGGVNAAATFAVIPLGAVWLLTRSPGPRRRALMTWWPIFTLLGTVWWLVPLFVMGAYSPPFLDYIETTTVTTFPTTVFDSLRGTSDWVPYVDADSRAGNDLITTPYLVLNSGVVLMVGFAGILHRQTKERAFLGLSVVLGVLMVAVGHTGAVEGWFAADARSLLDGALSPLRNVHKFDVVVRLPLVIGLALFLDRVVSAGRGKDEGPSATATPAASRDPATVMERSNRLAIISMVLLAVVGSVVPALVGRVTPAGAMLDVPQYWQQTADWLADHDEGTALVVPGAPFAKYLWGAPRDEPLQYYANSRWAVRNIIPLAPGANIRMLDEVERHFIEGDGSPGLAAYLRRSGVRHLVVRNDLQLSDDVPQPVVVHQVLRDSGLVRVASFGPDVGGGATLDADDGGRVVVNGGWQASYPAVEVFEVPGDGTLAVTAGAPPTVVGGPEDLADLSDLGVLGDAPVRLASDLRNGEEPAEGVPFVLTDGLREREHFFGRIHDSYSAALTPGDVPHNGSPIRDYAIAGMDRWSTTVHLDGARSVSASSSASDSTAGGGAERGELPYAALDRSRDTQWVSGGGSPWWRVDLVDPVPVDFVTVVGGSAAAGNQELRVVTSAGASKPAEVGPGQTILFAVPSGQTSWVRVEDASDVEGRPVAVAEVRVPGVEVERRLVTPVLPDGWRNPDAIVLRTDLDDRNGCVEVDGAVRCVASRVRTDEEAAGMARTVTLPEADDWEPELTVRPVSGTPLSRIIQRGLAVRILASSIAVPDVRAGPVAAVDGDPGTTWLPDIDDLRPSLTLRWLGERDISGIDLSVEEGTGAALPTRVRLVWPGGSKEVELRDGHGVFSAIRTNRLQLVVMEGDDTKDLGFDSFPAEIGVGISELEVVGVPFLPERLSIDARPTACGVGPSVELNGVLYDTFVDASPAQLQRGDPVPARICGPGTAPQESTLDLGAGENVVSVRSTKAFVPASLVLTREGASLTTDRPTAARESGGPTTRRLTLGGDDHRILALRQNANPGWEASQDGNRLRSVVLDGWQQGWVIDGTAPVRARFAPDGAYRAGVLGGLLALLSLVALCALLVWRRHREHDLPEPLAARALPALPAVCMVALVSGLLAGWTGLAVALAVAFVTRWFAPRWPGLVLWLLAAPCLAVGATYAIRPWAGAFGWAGGLAWPSYLMLVPLVGALMAAATGSALLPRRLRRSAGRSTTR